MLNLSVIVIISSSGTLWATQIFPFTTESTHPSFESAIRNVLPDSVQPCFLTSEPMIRMASLADLAWWKALVWAS